jgi:hypothetical protein
VGEVAINIYLEPTALTLALLCNWVFVQPSSSAIQNYPGKYQQQPDSTPAQVIVEEDHEHCGGRRSRTLQRKIGM